MDVTAAGGDSSTGEQHRSSAAGVAAVDRDGYRLNRSAMASISAALISVRSRLRRADDVAERYGWRHGAGCGSAIVTGWRGTSGSRIISPPASGGGTFFPRRRACASPAAGLENVIIQAFWVWHARFSRILNASGADGARRWAISTASTGPMPPWFNRLVRRGRTRGLTPTVLTFEPHPAGVLQSGICAGPPHHPARKTELLAECGAPTSDGLPFRRRVCCALSAEDFIDRVLMRRPAYSTCGHRRRFSLRRGGRGFRPPRTGGRRANGFVRRGHGVVVADGSGFPARACAKPWRAGDMERAARLLGART